MSNLDLIDQFKEDLVAEGISQNGIKKYDSTLNTISRRIGERPFRELTERDLKKFFADLERTEYAEETKRDFKVAVKRFWRWLYPDKEDPKAYPRMVRWIRTSFDRRKQKIIEEKNVLTREEVYRLVEIAPHLRDRAFITMLFEGCCRISEATNLKISDVSFDEKGYSFVCNGKNGRWFKRVMHKDAVQHMRDWIASHPQKEDPEAPLWVTLRTAHHGEKKASNRTFYNTIQELVKAAKITGKATNPHSFRDSWVTWASKTGIPESVIKKHATWSPDSKMLRVYQHMNSKDIDEAFLKVFGTDRKKELMRKMSRKDIVDAIVKVLEQKGVI